MFKKTFALLFSATAYVLFLGAFAYLVAFTMNLTPHSISGEAMIAPVWAAVIDIALVTLFALQHTIMARPWFKRAWTRVVPEHLERSVFVLVATAVMGLVVLAWQPIGGTIWNVSGGGLFALATISAIGWTAVPAVSFLTDHFELFGLRQAYEYAMGQAATKPEFKMRSIYKQVRHPMMLGFLMGLWATPLMTTSHLLFAGLFTAYIAVGTMFEERDLVAAHGDSYRKYQQEVPKLLPVRMFYGPDGYTITQMKPETARETRGVAN